MQKTLVTFNLALILQVGILDISKLLRNVLLRNAERLEKKKKITCELFDYLHVHGP